MTRRTIINLSAIAIVATGGYTLLAPAAVAATYGEFCDKMLKIMKIQMDACELAGGSYFAISSCGDTGYTIIPNCMLY